MLSDNKSGGADAVVSMQLPNQAIGVVWAQYGPYHFARVAALKKLAGPTIHAVEIGSRTTDYAWQRNATAFDLVTLCPDAVTEELSFSRVFRQTRRKLKELKIATCLLPSYSPKQSLAALLAAKSLGIRAIMMSESHAGTARAKGVAAYVKRQLVGLFDAALVGGSPQKRYIASMGMPERKIFPGYDAVDNDYFAARAEEIRRQAPEFRKRYHLPERYFLSLGRFVAKKNLATLLKAYRQFLDSGWEQQVHLVMVGSGEEERKLRALCAELRLPIYQKSEIGDATRAGQVLADGVESKPGVHFYGFRQIEENPVFYALAEAFVLPSLYEEWGLVVNEAMACSLPVVVSETVGCAEDLLERGGPPSDWPISLDEGVKSAGLEKKVRANGFVFDPLSDEELSRILWLMADAPGSRETMGRASRCIVEKFSCGEFARNALLAVQAAADKS